MYLSFFSILVIFLCFQVLKVNIVLVSNNNEVKKSFTPNTVPAGNHASYDLNIVMSEKEEFEVIAKVKVQNKSEDNWTDLVFYFIPNIFTKQTLDSVGQSSAHPGTVTIPTVKIDGEKVDFSLEQDTLKIDLNNELPPSSEVNVSFTYNFTLPDKGLRYTKNNGNYYLAQFYPMLATYRNKEWNKEDYRFKGETYHTNFSDFNVTYKLLNGYTLVSTSPNDPKEVKQIGTLQANNVKDFFAVILKEHFLIEKEVGNTNIRLFGFGDDKQLSQEVSEIASEAFMYFEKTIGPYPHNQLDIVLDGKSMEYPGVVTAYSIDDHAKLPPALLKSTVVHEIAHQWFYGIISNDPYHEAWLDEGFAEFATGLYFYSKLNEGVPYSNLNEVVKGLDQLPVNLSLDQYEQDKQSSYIYGKSNVMLWKLFEKRGEIKEAEKFVKKYYDNYKFKEIDSEEFIRFIKYYFNLKDNSVFKDWLEVK
ncbi:M1 family metallopeptidase [Niallia sp. MER 6]|uniref:M1 family metallopeptidase n=1 Tax=Niallia sp. MER 6 TaxID=2939567 RepID=UPI0020412E7E|nr:M1 family metallopeptidase [Niallia sp. MER 6]MCM3034250.1 M1 family metallopeptidase [Niallia sp. MER 6]